VDCSQLCGLPLAAAAGRGGDRLAGQYVSGDLSTQAELQM
jgi:hypothetical protein